MCDKCGKYNSTTDRINIVDAPNSLIRYALKKHADFCKKNNLDYPDSYKNLEKEIKD
jgi:ubiquitin C-terminal hydrolase